MSTVDLAQILQMAERLRRLVTSSLLPPTDGCLPEGLGTVLDDFSAAARGHEIFEPAGEIARSLATLLAHSGGQIPDEQTRHQVHSLTRSLLVGLSPEVSEPDSPQRKPLVAPVPLSQQRVSRRVALYIDHSGVRLMLQEMLAQAGFLTMNFNTLDELAQIDEENVPVAIIADLGLCGLDTASGAVFARLRQRFNPPPHLFCLADSTDISARLEAVRLGATRFFKKPVDIARLLAVLKGVTAQTVTQPFKALLIDDDRILGELYSMALNQAGVETLITQDPLQAPYLIKSFAPDVVVSDVYMPGCNGLELLAILRQDDTLLDTPIIFLSSENDSACQLEAINLGGDDFLTKPVNLPVFVATVIARARRARGLKRSRSEYRRILERMREIEHAAPERFAGRDDFEVNALFSERISLDDYVVADPDEPGAPH